jgi:hypothetical protein
MNARGAPNTPWRRQSRSDTPGKLVFDPTTAFASLLAIAVFLFAALVWLIHLEATLPGIRNPREHDASALLPGREVVTPGEHSVQHIDLELHGNWVLQELAGDVWQASVEPNDRLMLSFYGTELYAVARLGPEAGVAYVRVDGSAPAQLPQGEHGAVLDLGAIRARDQPVHIVSDLAHGEHILEITTTGVGEVALSGFIINAQTPFPWVFVLAYAGLLAGLLLVTRALVYQITTTPEPFRRSRPQPISDDDPGL